MTRPDLMKMLIEALKLGPGKKSTPEQRSEYELEIGPVEVERKDDDDDNKDLVS
jgi:hypothetical protein